jgi:hypothetical protein
MPVDRPGFNDKAHGAHESGDKPDWLPELNRFKPLKANLTDFTSDDFMVRSGILPKMSIRNSDFIMHEAEKSVGKPMYLPEAAEKMDFAPPELGCAASVSHVLKHALSKAEHAGNFPEGHKEVLEINVGQLERKLQKDLGAVPVKPGDARPGDIIIGRGDGSDQHVGILGEIEHGKRVVYHNKSGIWTKDTVDHRFGKYEDIKLLHVPTK